MARSRLDLPDDAVDQRDRSYSSDLATALIDAYGLIRAGRFAKAGMAAAPTRKLSKGSSQDRCRRAYRPGMSWQQLKTAAQVSDSTAKRYVKQFAQELSA